MKELKPTIYYELGYLPEDAAAEGNLSVRRYSHYLSRVQMIRGSGYYMNCLTVNIPNDSLRLFKLGVDYPPPVYHDKCYEDVMTITFLIEGAGFVGNMPVQRGDVFYTPPLCPQRTRVNPAVPWQTVWIQVSGGYEISLIEKLKKMSPFQFLYCPEPDNVRKMADFLIYSQDCAENTPDYIRAILQLFLSYIHAPLTAMESSNRNSSLHASQIQQSCDYIRRNLATVTASELADRSHFNRKYFPRLFRKVTGVSPQDYIINCKLEWVKFFLSESDMTIGQIMDAVGYRHRNGLITAFQKKYGCTPSTYRKTHAIQKK